jgi:hypothetical protein
MTYSDNSSPRPVNPRRVFAKLALAASIAAVAATPGIAAADAGPLSGPPAPPCFNCDFDTPPPPPPGSGGGGDWGPPPPPPGSGGGSGNPIGAPVDGVPPTPGPAPAPVPVTEPPAVAEPVAVADSAAPRVRFALAPKARRGTVRLRVTSGEAVQATVVAKRRGGKVATRRIALRAGVNRIAVRVGRGTGRIGVSVIAIDAAGNMTTLRANARR